jgi:hypothetical protein
VKERDHLGGLGGDGCVWDLLKQNLNDYCGDQAGLSWLRIEFSSWLL